MRLSVVVPAYDEEARLGSTLRGLRQYFAGRDGSVEIVVVDDGSRDATARVAAEELAGERHAQVIRYRPNRGKGFAVRTGVAATVGDYVLFTDADLATPIEELDRALALARDGYDIVVGSRGGGATLIVPPSPFRRLAAAIFKISRDMIVGDTGVYDSQCGFKLFRGDVARDIFARQRIDRFMFDAETLFIARRLGYRIVEMPVRWSDVAGSKVRVVRGALEMLPELLMIRLRHAHLRRADAGKRPAEQRA